MCLMYKNLILYRRPTVSYCQNLILEYSLSRTLGEETFFSKCSLSQIKKNLLSSLIWLFPPEYFIELTYDLTLEPTTPLMLWNRGVSTPCKQLQFEACIFVQTVLPSWRKCNIFTPSSLLKPIRGSIMRLLCN